MTEREQLIAYCATLFTLLAVFVAALIAAGYRVNVTEAFGLGTITGGLIGALRFPSRTAAGNTQADANLATVIDKLPPATTGTGPAVPLGPQPWAFDTAYPAGASVTMNGQTFTALQDVPPRTIIDNPEYWSMK